MILAGLVLIHLAGWSVFLCAVPNKGNPALQEAVCAVAHPNKGFQRCRRAAACAVAAQ